MGIALTTKTYPLAHFHTHVIVPFNQKATVVWNFTVRVFNKHTDLISSVGILAITTCLLVAKIFKNIPPLLPRIALAIFNFGGIIWLNIQVRDFVKCSRDFVRTMGDGEFNYGFETAVKVFLKGVDVLLTCAIFGASVVAALGFPHVLTMLYMTTRPLSLASLALTISTNIYDFFANKRLLKEMDELLINPHPGQQISQVMTHFLAILFPERTKTALPYSPQKQLASRLIKQLDLFTLEIFKESLNKKMAISDVKTETYNLFFKVKQSMVNKQAMTISNLSLIILGYMSMGVCKTFPDSLIEMASRWSISVLFTDDLINQKLFHWDLERSLKEEISHV